MTQGKAAGKWKEFNSWKFQSKVKSRENLSNNSTLKSILMASDQ